MGVKKSLLVVDMPKGTYGNTKIALRNAKLIMNKTKCDAIKLESNKKNYKIIEYLVNKKIPVMGHIGFTPQTKNISEVKFKLSNLLEDAKILQNAGISMIVLSMLTSEASQAITTELNIPTISYKSSNECSGRVEILYDLLGLKISNTLNPTKKNNDNYINFNFKFNSTNRTILYFL